jgi:hypothetical protein
MNRSTKSSMLDEMIGLLVRHFSLAQVRVALDKATGDNDEELKKSPGKAACHDQKQTRPNINNALELIRETDPEKHRLLSGFLVQLKDRKIFPESQDIRYFSQIVGLKEIKGKSRKDLIPKLMDVLLALPVERLRNEVKSAEQISEHERRQGFSVLTDKLLGEK